MPVHDPVGPFVLRIVALDEGESWLELVGHAGELEIDPAFVRVEGPVVARVRVYRVGDKLDIQGEIGGTVSLVCDRCLAPVSAPIDGKLRVFAERRVSRDRRRDEEVREDDLGIVYHDGRFVDLTDEVRQVFLVEVPWHILCREDCLGLCPTCGAEVNRGPCACPSRPVDSRWGPLAGAPPEHEQ